MGIFDIFKQSQEPEEEKRIVIKINPRKSEITSLDKEENCAKSQMDKWNEYCETQRLEREKELKDNSQIEQGKNVSEVRRVEMTENVPKQCEKSYEEDREKRLGVFGGYPVKWVNLPKKNIIILAIENTSRVREYKETVSKIISKIIEDNKDALFSIFRMGCNPRDYGIISYEDIQKDKIKEKLLLDYNEPDKPCLLYEGLKYIKSNINTDKTNFNKIEIDGKKYEISGYSIIFVGTANFDSDNNALSSEILKELKSNKIIKTIKYFSIEDKNTLNAAVIGFPVIGHIESNFYK